MESLEKRRKYKVVAEVSTEASKELHKLLDKHGLTFTCIITNECDLEDFFVFGNSDKDLLMQVMTKYIRKLLEEKLDQTLQ